MERNPDSFVVLHVMCCLRRLRYLELERMYAERPRRPEDLERIGLLERDVDMKEQLIQRTMVR